MAGRFFPPAHSCMIPVVMPRRVLRELLPYAFILFCSAVLFSPFLLSGKVFIPADWLFTFYPWKSIKPGVIPNNSLISDSINHNYASLYNRQLHDGGLKGWNPCILTGIPNTGVTALSGMSGRYHPLKLLLHRLFSTPVALTLLLFSHVTLMGVSMHLFLRGAGAGLRGALFGAIAYQFSGNAMAYLECETVVAAGALFPLVLLCMERFLGSRRYLFAFLGAACLGLFVLMGHLQFLFYGLILMTCYFGFLLLRLRRRRARLREAPRVGLCFGITCLGGLLIGAIELLPVAELLRLSSRIQITPPSYGDLFDSLGGFSFRSFITLIFPDYFGNPFLKLYLHPRLPHQMYPGSYSEMAAYLGVPTLFALLAAAVDGRSRRARFFLLLTLASVLLMTGTVFYYPFFKLVPGMNKMPPTRMIWLFTFTAVSAAGFGIRALERLRGVRRKVFLRLLLLLAGAVFSLAAVSALPKVIGFFNRELFPDGTASNPDLLATIAGLRSLGSKAILQPLLLCLGAAGLFALMVLAGKRRTADIAFAGIVALLAFELVGAAKNLNTVADPATVFPKTPAIDFLQRRERPFRVVLDWRFPTCVNTLATFGIEEADGYSSFYPATFGRLASFMKLGARIFSGEALGRWVQFDRFDSPFFDLMNVKYLLTVPYGTPEDPRWKLVYRGEADIYENTRVLPRAFAVHQAVSFPGDEWTLASLSSLDLGRTVALAEPPDPAFLAGIRRDVPPPVVTMVEHGEDTVRLNADLAANGWVVLTDTWYPGWKAYVEGRETPILRADVNFRALAVTAGKRRIVFRYEPGSMRLGGLLTLFGSLGTLAGAVWFGVRGRRSGPAPDAGDGRVS